MIEEQGTRIALNIDIEAPIVLFPSTSRSVDCLIADLGKLHAQNTFATKNPPQSTAQVVVIDNIDLDLDSVQLSRYDTLGST